MSEVLYSGDADPEYAAVQAQIVPSPPADLAASVTDLRLAAYQQRSDPLFFKAHAGELGTVEEGLAQWQAERDAIRTEITDPPN